jgi:hypothetical protein
MKRPYWSLLAPTALAILVAVLPLVLGGSTLYFRDHFLLHLPLKANQALAQGGVPEVDLLRGGEPMAGNANGLPFYPSNLLYQAADFFWAFNAHIWIHWLLTLFAFAWLARAAGLSKEGAAAAGVFWATGAYFLSQLGYYNLVAAAGGAPALVASWLEAESRRWLWPLSAFLLAALILAGDPFSVLLAVSAAIAALLFRPAPFPWRGLLLAGAGAALLAAPGLVELARVVPTSMRAMTSQNAGVSLLHSLPPAALLELLIPWTQGSIEAGFHSDPAPLFSSFFPGVLALAAALLACRRGALLAWQARWAATLFGAGLFLALGGYNPVVRLLYEHLPGLAQLRFPAKYSLLWAMGLALLGGLGFQRFVEEEAARRRMIRLLGGLALFYLAAMLLLPLLPAGLWQAVLGGAFPADRLPAEKLRWVRVLASLLPAAFLLWLVSLLARRSVALAAGLLLAAGSVLQLDQLEETYWHDEVARYRQPPAALTSLPADSLSFHRTRNSIRLPAPLVGDFPIERSKLVYRCAADELAPVFGAFWQRRYVLAQTADYLDSLDGYILLLQLHPAKDREALRVLRALGVDRWLADREIEPDAASQVELIGRHPTECGGELFVYRLADALPGRFVLVGDVRRVPAKDFAGFRLLASDRVDPRTTALLPGPGEEIAGRPNGSVRTIAESSDAFEVEVDSPQGGVLIARRNWLPLYRAFIDGQETDTVLANLLQLGVEVPAGRHLVRVAADRRPLKAAFAVSGIAAALLLAALLRLAPNRKGGSADPPPSG